MKKYLSHFSAAEMWKIPNIDDVFGLKKSEAKSVHVTISDHDARIRNKGKEVHSCALDLPAGAVTSLDGSSVASPELLFLELASKLSIHRLILLGLQLCSHPADNSSIPITTKQKLTKFLEKTPGHRGCRKAIRAVKYVENGSASVMESLVYMILTLPHALGGYGLNGAVFNQEIKLNKEARLRLKQKNCFVDLYYRQAKLTVEYDSFTHHSTPAEQGKDKLRSEALKRQGVDVLHLTTIQLYDKDACRDFAHNLAQRLGKRIRIRTKRFDEIHKSLRELLPKRG